MSVVLECGWCKKEFSKIRKTAKYCSQACNAKAWYENYKERGYVKKEKKPKVKVKRDIPVEKCVICGDEYRKTRKDKTTCSKECGNRHYYLKKTGVLPDTYKTSNVVGKVDIANEIEPYLLDWKRRRFFLNEIDLFRVIDLWDKLYPSKFISENIDKTEMFEGMIMDLIFHYKKYKKK